MRRRPIGSMRKTCGLRCDDFFKTFPPLI
jgi:hypothetical protein